MEINNPVFLVEDNQVDAMSVERAFKKLKIRNYLYRAENGVDALAMLRGEDGFEALDPVPGIILLDLNMPKMGGIEFLLELRNERRFDTTEVIVLTTSNWYNDKIRTFDLGISGYLVKPVKDSNLYAATLTIRKDYWLYEPATE